MVLHVLDDDELDFPFAGPTRFEVGLPEHLTCNLGLCRAGYLEHWARTWKKFARPAERRRLQKPLSDPLDAVLALHQQSIGNAPAVERRCVERGLSKRIEFEFGFRVADFMLNYWLFSLKLMPSYLYPLPVLIARLVRCRSRSSII